MSEVELMEQKLCGEHGPHEQIHAFRECWMRARLYLRAMHQAALGCAGLCAGNAEVRMEINALITIISDTNIWAESCDDQLAQLEQLLSAPEKDTLVH